MRFYCLCLPCFSVSIHRKTSTSKLLTDDLISFLFVSLYTLIYLWGLLCREVYFRKHYRLRFSKPAAPPIASQGSLRWKYGHSKALCHHWRGGRWVYLVFSHLLKLWSCCYCEVHTLKPPGHLFRTCGNHTEKAKQWTCRRRTLQTNRLLSIRYGAQ